MSNQGILRYSDIRKPCEFCGRPTGTVWDTDIGEVFACSSACADLQTEKMRG